MIKLFVTDLDGTLMTDINGLSTADQARLARLLDSGFPLTFATGRVIPSGLKALGNPSFQLPLIGHGGGVIQAPNGEVIHEESLETREVAEVLKAIMDLGMGLTVVLSPREDHGRLWWRPEGFTGMDKFIESRAWDKSFRELARSEDLALRQVVSMSCCGEPGVMRAMRQWVGRRPDLAMEVVHDPYLQGVEVGFLHRAGCSKGRSLRRLMDQLGLSKDEVCVLGDGANDLSLFEEAGWRVAPAGACDQILERADHVLEGSVLDFLEAEAWRMAEAMV